MEIALAGEKEEVGNVKIKILFPEENLASGEVEDLNTASLVVQIDFLNKKFLMLGDADFSVEDELVQKYGPDLQSDFIKIGHHGSRFSTGDEFLKIVKPQIAVICVGENSFGHPSLRTLNRLERAGIEVKRTDVAGNVVFENK